MNGFVMGGGVGVSRFLAARGADVLVTGDKDLLELNPFRGVGRAPFRWR